jgi:hypothetical protein
LSCDLEDESCKKTCYETDSTEEPVRYATGQVRLTSVDLEYEGYGTDWAVIRAFGNIYTFGSNVYGNNWSNRFTPTLTVWDTGASIRVSPNHIYYFTRSGNTFTARFYFGAYISLTLNTTTSEYVLQSPNGRSYVFDALTSAQTDKPFKQIVDRDGQNILVNRDGSGNITSIARSYSSLDTGLYYSGSTITLRVKGVDVRRVTYTYYGSGSSHGLAGDLQTAVVEHRNESGFLDRLRAWAEVCHRAGGLRAPCGGGA